MARSCSSSAKAPGTPKRLVIGSVDSAGSLWSLCTKQASRVSKKLRVAIHFRHKKRESATAVEEKFGDGGLWQRSILMGDKCQPLDFSGVIYYDSNGNQLDELPVRSPRASPLPSYLYSSAAMREK